MKKNVFVSIVAVIVVAIVLVGGYFVWDKYCKKQTKEPEKVINIVFNTDLGYKEYTKVALKSAIMNKKPKSVYNIHILCVDFNDAQLKEFDKFKTNNVTIDIVPVSMSQLNGIGDYEIRHYVTRADLFKFLMADLFPDLKKVLYIDGDTVIMKDLSDLYNTDISKYYLGAVQKYSYDQYWRKNWLTFQWEPYYDYTYNCGVLLLNLDKWRKSDIKKKLIKAKNNDTVRDLVTQRSFNEVVPIDSVYRLSPIYNAVARWTPDVFDKYEFKKIYSPYCDNYNSTDDILNNAAIIHYAGGIKPWSYPDSNMAPIWWKYAKLVNPNWKVEPDTNAEKRRITPEQPQGMPGAPLEVLQRISPEAQAPQN